jgi:hypothetical protein
MSDAPEKKNKDKNLNTPLVTGVATGVGTGLAIAASERPRIDPNGHLIVWVNRGEHTGDFNNGLALAKALKPKEIRIINYCDRFCFSGDDPHRPAFTFINPINGEFYQETAAPHNIPHILIDCNNSGQSDFLSRERNPFYMEGSARDLLKDTMTVKLNPPDITIQKDNYADVNIIFAHQTDEFAGQPLPPGYYAFDTVPTRIDPKEIAAAAEHSGASFAAFKDPSGRPTYAVIVGERVDKNPELSAGDAEQLALRVSESVRKTGGSVLVTTSPRTFPKSTQVLQAAFQKHLPQGTHFELYDFRENEGRNNPYKTYLGAADVIVVTDDSMSMASDVLATGKPGVMFHRQKDPVHLNQTEPELYVAQGYQAPHGTSYHEKHGRTVTEKGLMITADEMAEHGIPPAGTGHNSASEIAAVVERNLTARIAAIKAVAKADEKASAAMGRGLRMIHLGKAIYYSIKGDTDHAMLEGSAAASMIAMHQAMTNKGLQATGQKLMLGTIKKIGGDASKESAEEIMKLLAQKMGAAQKASSLAITQGTGRLLGKEITEKLADAGVKIAGRELPVVGAGISMGFSLKSAAEKDNWGDSTTEILSGTGEAIGGTVVSEFGLGFLGGEVGREVVNGTEYLVTFGNHAGDPSLTRLLMREGMGVPQAILASRMLPHVEASQLENKSRIGVIAFTLPDGHQVAIPKMGAAYPVMPAEIRERIAKMNGISETENLYRMMALAKQESQSMNPFSSSQYLAVEATLSKHFGEMEAYEDSVRQYMDFASRFNNESRPRLLQQLHNTAAHLNGRYPEEITPLLELGEAQALIAQMPRITAQNYPDAYVLLKENLNPGVEVESLSPKQQHHLLREIIPVMRAQLSTYEVLSGGAKFSRLKRVHEQYSQFMKQEYIPYTHKLSQYQPVMQRNDVIVEHMVDELNIIHKRDQLALLEKTIQQIQSETGLMVQMAPSELEKGLEAEWKKTSSVSTEEKWLDARAERQHQLLKQLEARLQVQAGIVPQGVPLTSETTANAALPPSLKGISGAGGPGATTH